MGSSYQTCAVTHMPIREDDRVVGFVLTKAYGDDPMLDGYTSQGGIWQTVSLSFRGVYDDSGFVSDIENRHAAISLRASCGVEFGAIIEAVEENRVIDVKLRFPYGESQLMVMFVHEEVYDRLSASTRTPYGREVDVVLETDRIDAYVENEAATSLATRKKYGYHDETPFAFESLEQSDHRWGKLPGETVFTTPYVSDFFISRKTQGVHNLLHEELTGPISEMWNAGDRDGLRSLLADCLKVAVFDENMGKLRRLWVPQCGLGSQETEYGLHTEMAGWVADRCRKLSMDGDYEADGDDELDEAPAPAM